MDSKISSEYSGDTNNSLSMLMSSLTQLKNAFAAAFAPVLNIVCGTNPEVASNPENHFCGKCNWTAYQCFDRRRYLYQSQTAEPELCCKS